MFLPVNFAFANFFVLTQHIICQIFLDRMTAETIARFLEPFTRKKEEDFKEPGDWVDRLTTEMEVLTHAQIQVAPANIQSTIHSANSGRIYFEQLHLHPVRLSFTFTQEWMEWSPSSQSSMLVQFIRGMVRVIAEYDTTQRFFF